MGDTGSLALGGALGAVAVATKHEIVLAIVGGLFVVEALSVIIQVLYFKMTGKRVFLMAPIATIVPSSDSANPAPPPSSPAASPIMSLPKAPQTEPFQR